MCSLLLHWQVLERKHCALCFWRAACTAKQKFFTSIFNLCVSERRAENDQFLKRYLATWLSWRMRDWAHVSGKADHAGMSWKGDCKGIGVRVSHSSWSPAQMIASTEQGLQPASPSGRVGCAARATSWAGGGVGYLKLVVGWEECEICLTCSSTSNPNQSCIVWRATQIEKSWCLQGWKMDQGKGPQLCVLLGACSGRHSNLACLEFGGSLKQGLWCEHLNFCPPTMESLCPLKSGREEVDQCVWMCFPVACCACHPSQPCDTAELSALAVFTRTGHLTVCYCCQMCLVYETNQMFFFSLSVPFFQSFFLNSAERRVLWHWPVAWQTWYTTSDRDYSGWDWKQICLNWFSRWLNTLKFFCTFEASETV